MCQPELVIFMTLLLQEVRNNISTTVEIDFVNLTFLEFETF